LTVPAAELALILAGAIVAGFVQGLSGFGFSLVAMSFWAWAIDPRFAAVLAVFGAFTGQLLAAFSVRRGAHLGHLVPLLAGGLLGIPLGLWLLPRLDALAFRAIIGAVLALWCPLMLFSGRIPHISRGGRLADGAVGACGGVLGALGGATGAVPTLWCTLRGFDKDVQRALIQNFNLATLGVTLVGYLASGLVTHDLWPRMAIVAPALVIPALLGARLFGRIGQVGFRRIVLGLLTASGIAMLASSVPGLIGRLA
jgi:uncharacterized membrane protein YfcA